MLRLLLALLAAVCLTLPVGAQVAPDAAKTGISRTPHLVCSGTSSLSVTGTTSETALATCAIPGSAMGLQGAVRVVTRWSMPTSANAKTVRIRHGGASGTTIALTAYTTNTFAMLEATVVNRGSASSQYYFGFGTRASDVVMYSTTPGTAAVNSAHSQDIVISMQLASAAESVSLESYEVWLLP